MVHPVPAGRTPLHVLAGPLHRLSGSSRFCNLLEREGFGYVEEVAVTLEGCLLEFRNSGPRFITAVRQVIADLGFGGAEARTWAVAERGAQELGDLLALAPGVGDLPSDVARSWDRIRRLSLQMLAGAALADGDLPRLARELIDELEERRRLILTSRTFAQTRRTYDSLAAELGVGRDRVRQLEASALQQLAGAAARHRSGRYRSSAAAIPGTHAEKPGFFRKASRIPACRDAALPSGFVPGQPPALRWRHRASGMNQHASLMSTAYC